VQISPNECIKQVQKKNKTQKQKKNKRNGSGAIETTHHKP
jgi:hypothetical protein